MTHRALLLPLLLLAAPAQAWSPQIGDLHEILTKIRQLTFEERSITSKSTDILRDLQQRFGGPLQEQYTRFVNKVLFIRDPRIVGHSDFQHDPLHPGQYGPWTLPALLQRIFDSQAAGAAAAETDLKKVADVKGEAFSDFNTAWTNIDPKRHLGALPLRLLAVVNRLDLGRIIVHPSKAIGADTCPPGNICGGELHFVYAATPRGAGYEGDAAGPYFTFILEFVLPPLSKVDFRALTLDWTNEFLRPDDDASLRSFEDVLENFFRYWSLGKHAARLRVNSRTGGLSWRLFQYTVTAQGLVSSPLNQQPALQVLSPEEKEACVTRDWPLAQYLSSPDNVEGVLHSHYDFSISSQRCPAKPPAVCSAPLDTIMKNVLTLSSGVVQEVNSEKARFALSLNSCTGCHGFETHERVLSAPSDLDLKTQFDQVKYPPSAGKAAGLSRFLTGSASGGEPSLFESWSYSPHRADPCGSTAEHPPVYRYNDLVRRFVFHLVAVGLPTGLSLPVALPGISVPSEITAAASAALNATWDTSLNAAGLTAWQPH